MLIGVVLPAQTRSARVDFAGADELPDGLGADGPEHPANAVASTTAPAAMALSAFMGCAPGVRGVAGGDAGWAHVNRKESNRKDSFWLRFDCDTTWVLLIERRDGPLIECVEIALRQPTSAQNEAASRSSVVRPMAAIVG